MPAVHIRDVDEAVLDTIREIAPREQPLAQRRLVATLEERARWHRQQGEVARRLAEIASRVRLPADAPKPEDLIRADRDSR